MRIREGEKERIQIFEGVVIALKRGPRPAFTVRKVSYNIGVERVFPLNSPAVDKIELVSSGKVRRAKLYYLRDLRGKAARLKERDRYGRRGATAGVVVPERAAPAAEATDEAEAAE